MSLVRVSEETRIKLTMIREALSFKEGRTVNYNDVIKELLKCYEESAKKPR
jgi:hypothetical protein